MFDYIMPQEKNSSIGQRIDFSENLWEVFRDLTIKLDTEVRPRCPDLKDTIWMPLLSGSDLQIDDQALGLGN
ncbi:hypothetical protein [Pseudomonas sp. BN417]|uniref:hypothetical protein n=1 Tax=Pseudomonas sp. BN417 TaxID=2567890 RepID=UPI002453F51B|nr:hypothetical protein [Pseudomonas sp. BN417]